MIDSGSDKVVAFITHGGYNSVGESISTATPIVAIPLFGDQFRWERENTRGINGWFSIRNARMAEYRKFGARLYKRDITTDNLNKALHKVINDPRWVHYWLIRGTNLVSMLSSYWLTLLSYLLSAREVQSIALSSIVHPGHSIRHTINFTLSHPHYNRDLPQLGLISLYSLDVIAFLFLLPSILLYLILRKIAGWYYWSCCDLAYKEKAE